MKISTEYKLPMLISLVVAFILLVSHEFGLKLPDGSSFYSSIVALGGIFSAFISTMKSILISGTSKLQVLKGSGHIEDLKNYLSSAMDSSLILCSIGALGFFEQVSSCYLYPVIVASCFVYSLLSLRRVYRIISLIMM